MKRENGLSEYWFVSNFISKYILNNMYRVFLNDDLRIFTGVKLDEKIMVGWKILVQKCSVNTRCCIFKKKWKLITIVETICDVLVKFYIQELTKLNIFP